MSKTVKLLLERREIEPSEFTEQRDRANYRWRIFLHENLIELDDPRTYPSGKRDEELYELVMERVLTQIDLAPPPMLTIDNITKQALAVLERELSVSHFYNRKHP